MIKLFEGFLKRKRRDPFEGWVEMLREMERERDKIKDAIINLQKSEDELKSTMFKNLPKEKQEEILKKQKENREKIEKQKAELEAKYKEVDPYGEEEWNNPVEKEWDWLEDEDDENLMKRHLNTIKKAKNHIKKLVIEESQEHAEIDPYGEEIWGDDPVLVLLAKSGVYQISRSESGYYFYNPQDDGDSFWVLPYDDDEENGWYISSYGDVKDVDTEDVNRLEEYL